MTDQPPADRNAELEARIAELERKSWRTSVDQGRSGMETAFWAMVHTLFPEEARKHSQKAYDLVKRAQPFPAAIFDTHGWVLVQCGQLNESIEILHKVVRQSNMPEAHYHLGEAYVRKGDYRKAQESLRLAAQSIPETIAQGGTVTADLEKKIQASLEKANQLDSAARGGQAGAR